MKRNLAIVLLIASIALCGYGFATDDSGPIYIPESPQRVGDSAAGYQYLTTGNFLKSGISYKYFTRFLGTDTSNLLHRTGMNATVSYGYNVVESDNGINVVIPTCLKCHAQMFDGKLCVGLGNTSLDFTNTHLNTSYLGILKTVAPRQYKAGEAFYTSMQAVMTYLQTETRGVNIADGLAAMLIAHRDKNTLAWSDEPVLTAPAHIVPTDVPAWWLLRKKHAMFYTGFGRGDFTKFLMLSNILTVKDSSEAREVDSHFNDVLAYICSLRPPKYPHEINNSLAAEGKEIFINNCSRCHGTYGDNWQYPNLLIPEHIIQTDSALFKGNQQDSTYRQWFNTSWFVQGSNPAHLVESNGYVAPPLDGVWITAPYFHNGSVPTLEAVLDSKARPRYWLRNFAAPKYDYENVGWQYTTLDTLPQNNKWVYNTTLTGYGNYGHYFGDRLSNEERKAVIEYLKTL